METKLTIFTPTYNRKHLLPNLYSSLKMQTNKNFVWLVIDDGSSDGTEELFNAWKEEIELSSLFLKNPLIVPTSHLFIPRT